MCECARYSPRLSSLWLHKPVFHLGWPRGPRLPSSLVFTRSYWAVEGSLRSLIRRFSAGNAGTDDFRRAFRRAQATREAILKVSAMKFMLVAIGLVVAIPEWLTLRLVARGVYRSGCVSRYGMTVRRHYSRYGYQPLLLARWSEGLLVSPIGIVLLVILVLILFGGIGGPYIHSGILPGYGFGYGGIGVVGVILIVVLILVLSGRL